jgi:hypothetical protein
VCLSADSLGLSSLVQVTQGKVLACVSGEGIIPFDLLCRAYVQIFRCLHFIWRILRETGDSLLLSLCA